MLKQHAFTELYKGCKSIFKCQGLGPWARASFGAFQSLEGHLLPGLDFGSDTQMQVQNPFLI